MKRAQEGTFPIPRHTGHTAQPGQTCALAREILDRVGDKWSVLVVALLRDGRMRFTEIKRATNGVSQRMLTLTLRALERDGLVTRTVHPTVPPRVEYELTDLGRTLLEPVRALAQWSIDNRDTIRAARERYDGMQSEAARSASVSG